MKKEKLKEGAKKVNTEARKAVKQLVSAVLIVGIAAVTTFFAGISPDEEAARLEKETFGPETEIEYVVDLPEPVLEFTEVHEEKARRVRSKKWSLLSIPMWLAGHFISLLLTPVIGKILSYVLIAAFFFGILCICLKIMYPDTPLKELLTKRNILTFICCTGVFIAALHVPEILHTDTDYHGLLSFLAGALAIVTMVLLCDGPKEQIEI